MVNGLKSLPDDPVELQGMVTLLASEVKSQAMFVEKLQHQLHGANRHHFGSTPEALDQLQLSLENEEIAAATRQSGTPEPKASEPKNKPRRKPLPEHLERNEQVLTPGDDCRECGGRRKTLGQDITEELGICAGSFFGEQDCSSTDGLASQQWLQPAQLSGGTDWSMEVGSKLKARSFANQQTEVRIGVSVLNKMTDLDRAGFEVVRCPGLWVRVSSGQITTHATRPVVSINRPPINGSVRFDGMVIDNLSQCRYGHGSCSIYQQ